MGRRIFRHGSCNPIHRRALNQYILENSDFHYFDCAIDQRSFTNSCFFIEILKFMGDGVFEYVTKQYLYRRFSRGENEGSMTEKKIVLDNGCCKR